MKVIKRDGRIVDYDKSKIVIAINKANKEVQDKEKATEDDIKKVIKYIEDLNKKRILVEDMQDIIEAKLMEFGKYELAKKYIVYRYTRALVRKSNTTDASILGLIRNGNRNINDSEIMASTQRNLIAGEVSKDLTKRILLPEKITKAWNEGALYFHDAEYFVQPIINSSYINLKDMFENGFVINKKKMGTPKNFGVACILLGQIIAAVASNQYGELSINMKDLGKYLRKSREKIEKELKEDFGDKVSKDIIEKRLKLELSAGIQTIEYQINTLMTTNGHEPLVNLILDIDKEDEYLEENVMIIEETLKQRLEGIRDENENYITPKIPKLIYVLDELNNLNGGKYDNITRLAIECSLKRNYPIFISAKKVKEYFGEKILDKSGVFNQGLVTINLPQIAILADKDENKFFEILDTRLELCKEALMCRHYALLGTSSKMSPIHWRYGGISRLDEGEKIDKLLSKNNSSLYLGYNGIYETVKIMKDTTDFEGEGKVFAIKIMKFLKDKISIWKKETDIIFYLYGNENKKIGENFVKKDKEQFGTIEGITNKEHYINSYHIEKIENKDIYDVLKLESEFQKILTGYSVSKIEINKENNINLEELIKFAYENIQCLEIINEKNIG